MLVTVLLAVSSRKQRSEAAFFPFDQGQGWLQLELNLALLAGGLLVLCVWCCSPGHAMASCRRKECSHVQEKNPTFQSPHCEQFYLNIDSKQTWRLAQGGLQLLVQEFWRSGIYNHVETENNWEHLEAEQVSPVTPLSSH